MSPSEAAKAWLKTFTKREIGTLEMSGTMTFEAAFLAGAAWQAEQDAKLAEGPLFGSFSGKKIAERIRKTAFDASIKKLPEDFKP